MILGKSVPSCPGCMLRCLRPLHPCLHSNVGIVAPPGARRYVQKFIESVDVDLAALPASFAIMKHGGTRMVVACPWMIVLLLKLCPTPRMSTGLESRWIGFLANGDLVLWLLFGGVDHLRVIRTEESLSTPWTLLAAGGFIYCACLSQFPGPCCRTNCWDRCSPLHRLRFFLRVFPSCAAGNVHEGREIVAPFSAARPFLHTVVKQRCTRMVHATTFRIVPFVVHRIASHPLAAQLGTAFRLHVSLRRPQGRE